MIDARISFVRIENFRGIRKPVEHRSLEGEGVDDAIIVAGPNGCGKTSFIEGILLCLGREQSILDQLDEAQAEPGAAASHWRAQVPPGAVLKVELRVQSAPGTELGTLTPCRLVIECRTDEWSLKIDAEGQPTRRIDGMARVREILNVIELEYFSSHRAPRLMGGVRPSSGGSIARGRYRLRQFKQRIIDERTRGSFGGSRRDATWLARLNEVWASLRGGDGTFIDARITEPMDPESDFDLFLVREGGEDPFDRICPLDHLSSGELEWLTIAGSLILVEFGGLLVIDEPELHQHPEWQQRIMPILRSIAPKAQLVIATHADAPWSQSYSFQRLLLVAEDDPRARISGESQ